MKPEVQISPNRISHLAQMLIRTPSFLYEESPIAHTLAEYLTDAGFETELQEIPLPDKPLSHQVVARWKGREPGRKTILCGHLDVLEVYRPEQWSRSPFSGDIVDGWIHGNGSLNMKGGLAAMIGAVEALREARFDLCGEIVLAGVMGEIGGGIGIRHLLERERDFDCGIVLEPTNLNVATISVGAIQGIVRLWGDTSYNKPHPNPIYAMGKVLEAMGPAYEPLRAGGWVTFEACEELPGFPRINARRIASRMDSCEIFVDMRSVPGQTPELLRADFERLLNSLDLKDHGIDYEILIPANSINTGYPAMGATAVESPVVKAIVNSHTKVFGKPPVVGAGDRIGLASDTGYLKAAGIPAVDYGPGKHPRWPMIDECIRVDDVMDASRVILGALLALHRSPRGENE